MKKSILLVGLVLTFVIGCEQSPKQTQVKPTLQLPGAIYKDGPLIASMKDAGFYYGDATYHGIISASDGNAYYFICSHNINSSVHMFKYNPKTDDVTMIADLNEVLGEDRTKMYPQGKVHSRIYEHNGKLYFGTHAGSYHSDGKHPELAHYPGGHFMSYDLAAGEFEDFGIGAPEQGLITVAMDKQRGRLYSLGWPDVVFCYYDMASDTIKSFEPASSFETRALALDPRTGNVYWPDSDGTIVYYHYAKDEIERLEKPRLDNRPFLETPNEISDYGPESQQVAWRDILWSEAMQRFYGIILYNECLFSFDPLNGEFEIIDRMAAAPKRKSGETAYGSLAFDLSPDGKTVYYIAAGDVVDHPLKSTKIRQCHLVTYDIPLRRYVDHGIIELDDGRKPFADRSIAVGRDGNLFIAGWIPYMDIESEKGRKIIEKRYSNSDKESLEKAGIDEINLMVLRNPLSGGM